MVYFFMRMILDGLVYSGCASCVLSLLGFRFLLNNFAQKEKPMIFIIIRVSGKSCDSDCNIFKYIAILRRGTFGSSTNTC